MTHDGALDLLNSTHRFPGSYTIKAIGGVHDDFVGRIVAAAQDGLKRPADVRHTTRSTPHGNHVAVTLDLSVLAPEEVIRVYKALQAVKGLRFLM